MKQKLRKYLPRRKSENSSGFHGVTIEKLALLSGGLLLCFIILNLAVYVIFLHRTFPNTRIANYAIGATSYSALPQKINSLALLPPAISLKQQAQNSSIKPSQLGIQIDTVQIAAAAKSRAWLPLENLLVPHKLSISMKVNQVALKTKLAGLALIDKHDPVDARIVIQNNQFQLADAANGYQLDPAKAAATITAAIKRNQTTIDLPFTTTVPAVTNTKLQPALQQLQAQQAVSLSYTYKGKTSQPSAAIIAGWYASTSNSYTLQDSKIQAYITQLGASNNIQVDNMAQAITATKAAIQKTSAMTFALIAVPPTICSGHTEGKLVLVSITQQHMWACQGPDQVYDTAVTTGAYQVAGDATPTGTWHIYAKETNTHLIGPTWDDYVNYWLPFYSDYGFHDASWQTFPFGGPEYPADGSHGCVHLPLAAMAWLYGWAQVGTTVTITN